jgi:hypothetical protein
MAAKGVKKTKTATQKKISGFHSAALDAGLVPQAGKEAVEGSYRAQIQVNKGGAFSGSVDVDGHFRAAEPQSHRWDYGIGVQLSNGQELVCWVEPHPASSTSQISKMLAKLAWLKSKLDTPAFKKLKAMTHAPGHTGTPYYWLRTVSGECRISANSKEARLLALQGLRMPAQHLILP